MNRVHRRTARKGNAAFTVLTSLVLLGFTTLTVDIGHARKVKAEIQVACDSAAHAGLAKIDGTDAGVTAAENNALSYGTAHYIDQNLLTDAVLTIETGVWDFDASSFTAGGDATDINAVRCVGQTDSIASMFGLAAFGDADVGAGATSIAVLPPPTPATAVSCYLPIAIPQCRIESELGSGIGTFDVVTSDSNNDNAAWASLPEDEDGNPQSPNASFIMGQLDPEPGEECQGATIGDSLSVNNGEIASAYSTIDSVLDEEAKNGTMPTSFDDEDYVNFWPDDLAPDYPDDLITPIDNNGDGDYKDSGESSSSSDILETSWGNTIQGPIMIFEGEDADSDGIDDFCDDDQNPNFTQEWPLAGFVWGAVYDVDETGSDSMIQVRINTEFDFTDYATAGGGDTDYGLVYQEDGWVGVIEGSSTGMDG